MHFLGNTLCSDLRMFYCIDSICILLIHVCYDHMHVVAKMTTVQLIYASRAWWCYLTTENRGTLEQQIARMKCWGHVDPEILRLVSNLTLPLQSWFLRLSLPSYHKHLKPICLIMVLCCWMWMEDQKVGVLSTLKSSISHQI